MKKGILAVIVVVIVAVAVRAAYLEGGRVPRA